MHEENGFPQAVLVHLDGVYLPQVVYEQCDLATLEDRLTDVIGRGRLGQFDGNEVSTACTVLYMYGPDAERLFSGIESTLRACALCQGARVVVRQGAPGSAEREVKL